MGTVRRGVGLLVNIDVDDIARAERFYTEALGLTVGRRFKEPWLELLGAGVPIYLLQKDAGTPATAIAGSRADPGASAPGQTRVFVRHWTPVHLDIVVDSLELAVDLALHAGAVLESPIAEQPYGRIAMFADPFGHGFCLIEFNQVGYDAAGL